jgi:hypothetical protein
MKDLIKAHLNLYAVLQNLEELGKLDESVGQMTKDWDLTIQFSVRNGPAAFVEFKKGVCRHGRGAHSHPTVKLYFLSPGHLNRMFDGQGTPIPLKGFARLGFLQKEFGALTKKLEYYLKPEEGRTYDAQYLRVNTTLTMYTAAYAVRELALLEPTCKKVAAATPPGIFQMGVMPSGPYVHLIFGPDSVEARKGSAAAPTALMTIKDLDAANQLLNGKLDAFKAVGQGDVRLQGVMPIIDNVGLILDRVEAFLK